MLKKCLTKLVVSFKKKLGATMKYNKLGKTGLEVSRLGLGGMRFPLLPSRDKDNKSNLNVDIRATCELVERAYAKGITYYDTAYFYHSGISETVLGHAIAELGIRDKIVIATKLPPIKPKNPEEFESIFEEQCQRLKVDYIDCYLLHNVNAYTLTNFEKFKAFEMISRLKKEGRIGHLGFSFHDNYELFEQVLEKFEWDFCQIQYNFVDEFYQAGVKGLKKAASMGLGVTIMEPLKGGALAATQPKEIEAMWEGENKSPAKRGLSWVLNHPEVSVVLSGMNSIEQVDENVLIAEHEPLSLSSEEIAKFTKSREIYAEKQRVPCAACSYCIPCPFGVDIPSVFALYNDKYLFGLGDHANIMYSRVLTPKKASGAFCTGCKKCLKKCPQHIDIPTELKNAHEDIMPSA